MARPADQELDSHLLGTTRSPGRVKFSGHDRKKNWNIKKAKGKTGASTSLEGDDPLSFTAVYSLADDDAIEGVDSEFPQWDAFQKLIESTTNGPKPFALPIIHPDLLRQGITEVTNGGIGGMVHDGKGGATVTVTFQEYKPEKKKPAASPGAKGAGTTPGAGAAKPDPNAARKAELAGLLEEAKRPG